MRTVTINATQSEVSRYREELVGVFGSLDAGRPNSWGSYGYKTELRFDDYRQAYERGGAGHGAVHRILDKCWQALPRIKASGKDAETPWETKLAALFKAGRLWPKLRDLDRRNLVGHYAALIYRVADGKPLREPLQRAQKLVDLLNAQPAVQQWVEAIEIAGPGFINLRVDAAAWLAELRAIAALGGWNIEVVKAGGAFLARRLYGATQEQGLALFYTRNLVLLGEPANAPASAPARPTMPTTRCAWPTTCWPLWAMC